MAKLEIFKLGHVVFLLTCLFQVIFFGMISWFLSKDVHLLTLSKVSNLNQGSSQLQSPKSFRLFVAILTHSIRKERRDAIRETWMQVCDRNSWEVICSFFTDEVGLDELGKQALKQEQRQNNDLVILNATDSFAFAERLLLVWEWAQQNINYDYFLRIDDDHFLCVDRVLRELRERPKNGLYWGFIHCQPRVVRVDEAWLMVSRNLVSEIMSRRLDESLYCSPYGDQAVAMWINRSKQDVIYFMDNQRIVHKSAGENPAYLRTDICETYVSLHGSYPRAMKQFWLLSQTLRKKKKKKISYEIPEIVNFTKLCPFSPIFDYKAFLPEYQFEPKLCHLKPKWSISDIRHGGREETGERYSSY